jgi:hypothetical protein
MKRIATLVLRESVWFMGIRALAFLAQKDFHKDPGLFTDESREALFRLGAFGFETWTCTVYQMLEGQKKDSASSEVRVFAFSDCPEVITLRSDIYLVADSAFVAFLTDLGFLRRPDLYKVEGSMAQLGDFKIRYGVLSARERGDKVCGIVIDLEYLPAQLLTADFSALFQSVCRLITKEEMKFCIQPPEREKEYSLLHLGRHYSEMIRQIVSP